MKPFEIRMVHMTDIELRKLKRADLLEMLIDQSKENENLQQQLNDALNQLQQREIKINQAGSIAEAALQINGVFEAAQNACAQYLENIERLHGDQEKIRAEQETISTRILAESQEKAAQILAETEQKCRELEHNTREKCAKMIAAAKEEAAAYWDELSQALLHSNHQKEIIDEN